MAHQGKYAKFERFFDFSGPRKKWAGKAPNGAGKVFFRLTQTLPTFWMVWIRILRIFIFEILWITNFWRFPEFQNLARARLGPGQAGLEPSGPNKFDFLMFELATPCFVQARREQVSPSIVFFLIKMNDDCPADLSRPP